MPHRQPEPKQIIFSSLRRILVEAGPALIFFAVFAWKGLMAGTAAFMAAAGLSVAISAFARRALPSVPLITAGIVLCLGGLTLVLDEATFIKMQPTVVNGLFAIAIAGAKLTGNDVLKRGFSPALRLDDRGWTTLTWRAVVYLALLAVANEIVWRSFSTIVWVSFKSFVVVVVNIVFVLANVPMVCARWQPAPDRDQTPDAGDRDTAAEGAADG